MLIKKENIKTTRNSESCKVRSYNFSTLNIGFAIAKIDGCYPEKGQAINSKSDLIYYIISGKGTIFIENINYEVKTGDAILIKKNEWYYVEGQKLEIALSSAPAWSPEQYKIINNNVETITI